LANVPPVIGALSAWPRMASGGYPVDRFFQIVKNAHQERALSAPCSLGLISALRGRSNAADRRNPSLLLSLYRCCTRVSMRASAIQHALSQNQKICEKEAEIAALRKRYERLTARKRQVKNMTG
jgi:hypothetical protein